VELEKIALTLRPRQGWEAVDLGFRMAMRWARPLWAVWFTVFLPVAAVLSFALAEHPWIAALLVWWLKPLYDRYLLFVLSRAVFGATPSLRETLAASGTILRSGVVLSLLTRFIDFSRSFNLPVVQLEGQRGAAARARRKLLGIRAGGFAVGLTIICIHFEWVVMYGLFGLRLLFETDVQWGQQASEDATFWWENVDQWWGLTESLFYFAALSVIEPFYVAGGFALYLNRRVMLEAWDIELSLKRFAARYAPIVVALAVLGAIPAAMPPAVAQVPETGVSQAEAATENGEAVDAEETAQDDGEAEASGTSNDADEGEAVDAEARIDDCDEGDDCDRQRYQAVDTEIRREAHKILAEPDFGSQREIKRWKRIGASDDEDEDREESSADPSAALMAIGELFRILAYLVLAAIVIGLVYALLRLWLGAAPTPVPSAPPAVLFGLAIAPESLPEDVAAAARALIAEGKLREALSLLYRGALSNLVHVRGMRIGRGATEGDVQRLAANLLDATSQAYLRDLIGTWTETAYAARLPEAERIERLCAGFSSLNGSAAPA
jgi:hypothetical protein